MKPDYYQHNTPDGIPYCWLQWNGTWKLWRFRGLGKTAEKIVESRKLAPALRVYERMVSRA